MALANKKTEDLFDKTGSGKKRMTDTKQAQVSQSFASGIINEFPGTPDSVEALIYQTKLIQEDIDEVRRFIISEVGSTNYDDKIKVLPNEFMSNDDSGYERVMVEDDTVNNFSIRVGSTSIEMYAMVQIPKGKKVTHGQVYASQNRTVTFYDVNYTTGAALTVVSGTANSNTQFYNTKTSSDVHVSSTATNYLLIKVNTTSTGDKIYGAELTIADI